MAIKYDSSHGKRQDRANRNQGPIAESRLTELRGVQERTAEEISQCRQITE